MPKSRQSTERKPKRLPLGSINATASTQSRAEIDGDAVADYAERMEAGVEFPPVVVFFDGNNFWLADGFHRYRAAKRLKLADIPCDVRDGNVRDAKIFAACSNQEHGLRRTNADKRKAVEILLGDSEWSGKSDNEIAEACGVHQTFVSKMRPSLKTDLSARTGRDGRKQKASSAKRSAAQKQRHAVAPVKEFDPDEHDAPEDEPEEAAAPAKEPNVIGEITALLDNQPAYVLIAVRDWINERLK